MFHILCHILCVSISSDCHCFDAFSFFNSLVVEKMSNVSDLSKVK